jgi:hypothetical protein
VLEHGLAVGRFVGGEAFLADGADRDLAFDGLMVADGRCGA